MNFNAEAFLKVEEMSGGLVISAGIVIRGNPPLPPGAVDAEPLSGTSVRVFWVDDSSLPANATRFKVERSTDQENWVEVDTVREEELTDTGLTAGTTYYYRVTSKNTWGETLGLTIAQATTPSEGPPDAPSGLSGTVVSSSVINWSWTDNSDNDEGFELQRDTVNTFDNAPVTIEISEHTNFYGNSGLAPETTYYARVRAVNSVDNSDWSNTASATTSAAGSDAEFGWTPVTVLEADLEQWTDDERVRTGLPTEAIWLWKVDPYDWDDSGYPGLVVSSHHDFGGTAFWRNNLSTPGGNPSFTWALPGELGTAEPYQIGAVAGSLYIHDHDGDGRLDVNPKRLSNPPKLWRLNSSNELEETAETWHGGTYVTRFVPNGDNPPTLYQYWSPANPTDIDNRVRWVHTWNGSGYTRTEDTEALPSGIPQAVRDALVAGIVEGQALGVAEFFFGTTAIDLNSDGVDDLIVWLTAGYAGSNSHLNKGWYLENNGDGTYTDKTADWGLPNTGVPLILEQRQGPMIRPYPEGFHLHKKIDGTGAMHLFVGSGGSTTCGVYRWNGTGYTRQLGPLTTAMAGHDNYPVMLWALPLKNQEDGYDLVYRRPRLTSCQYFLNDGSGNFTQWTQNASGNGSFIRTICWDPWGFIPQDMNNNGLIDLIHGGHSGLSGSSAPKLLSLTIFKNTTTNPGNYLKVKLLRPSGGNRRGVGGFTEAFVPNTSTLIMRWMNRFDGLPIHFGLGDRTTVDVKVTWPDLSTTLQEDVAANQTITVTGE